MITLEKIDQVVERTGVSYHEAKEALELCDGNVVEAIIHIEKGNEEKSSGSTKISDILDTLKEFLRRDIVTRIIVSDDDNVLLNIPVTVGAIGVVLAPVAAVVGVGAAIVTNLKFLIIDHNGETTDLNKVTAERLEILKKKGEQVKRAAEEKAEDIKEHFKEKKNDIEDEFKVDEENVKDAEIIEEENTKSDSSEQ